MTFTKKMSFFIHFQFAIYFRVFVQITCFKIPYFCRVFVIFFEKLQNKVEQLHFPQNFWCFLKINIFENLLKF